MTANGSSDTDILRSQSTATAQVGLYSNTVVDNADADKALSAGTFAHDNATPIGIKITTSLAGVSNTVLQSGAGQPGLIRSIHKLEVLRTRRLTTAIRAGKWNIFKGKFLNNQNQTVDNPTVATDSLASDNAATPTRAVPGELVYKTSAPVPVQDNYKAKTS
jgi:hypothetical protein